MAQEWCLAHGVLGAAEAEALYKRVCKRKGIQPAAHAPALSSSPAKKVRRIAHVAAHSFSSSRSRVGRAPNTPHAEAHVLGAGVLSPTLITLRAWRRVGLAGAGLEEEAVRDSLCITRFTFRRHERGCATVSHRAAPPLHGARGSNTNLIPWRACIFFIKI